MSDTPRKDTRTPEQKAAAERRMTGGGIAKIGDKVIWDGEAEEGGFAPLTKHPVPDSLVDVDYPEDEDIAGTPSADRK